MSGSSIPNDLHFGFLHLYVRTINPLPKIVEGARFLFQHFQKFADPLQVFEVRDNLNPRIHLVNVCLRRRVTGFVQRLLKFHLADRRAEFYGVAFDHSVGVYIAIPAPVQMPER